MAIATIPAVLLAQPIIASGQWTDGPTLINAALLLGGGVVGGLIYSVAATLLGLDTLKAVAARLRKRLR
jgi:hypothetical protein